MTVVGLVALGVPILTTSVAQAEDHGPKAVSVDIRGGDHFRHPGEITNDYHFPADPIVIAQGGTITFMNKTDDVHTISLVAAADVPDTTAQVDNCELCNSINNVYGINNPGLPNGVQLDNGAAIDDPAQNDADLIDTGAIATITNPGLVSALGGAANIQIADFDAPSHTTQGAADTVGDSTLIDTTNPNRSVGFATQRTIVVTAQPGLYHFICTLHPWMQGTIKVVKG